MLVIAGLDPAIHAALQQSECRKWCAEAQGHD
jgi:hypothetical protein